MGLGQSQRQELGGHFVWRVSLTKSNRVGHRPTRTNRMAANSTKAKTKTVAWLIDFFFFFSLFIGRLAICNANAFNYLSNPINETTLPFHTIFSPFISTFMDLLFLHPHQLLTDLFNFNFLSKNFGKLL